MESGVSANVTRVNRTCCLISYEVGIVRGKSFLRSCKIKSKGAESEEWCKRECHVDQSYALFKMM